MATNVEYIKDPSCETGRHFKGDLNGISRINFVVVKKKLVLAIRKIQLQNFGIYNE